MPIIEESGGRLNAFAKEPQIQIVEKGSDNKASRVIVIAGIVMVGVLIALTLTIT